MSRQPTIAVYGAYGHTGRLVLNELVRRGLPAKALGRDAARLQAVAREVDVPWQAADVGDAPSLDAALAGAAAVVLCAGPFEATAAPVLDAALRAGIPYFDTSAEPDVVVALHQQRHAQAERAGIAAVQCLGYFGALADWATDLAARGSARVDAIQVAYALSEWIPTAGSRAAGARLAGRRFVVEDGRLELRQGPPPIGEHAFGDGLGAQRVLSEYPGPEVVLLHRRLQAREIRTAMGAPGLRHFAPGAPAVASADLRNGAFRVEVRVASNVARSVAIAGTDLYQATAPIVVNTVQAVLADPGARAGVLTPAQAVDSRLALAALEPFDVQVELGA